MKDFSIIVAMDQNHGIGRSGDLPWKISADMQHFKDITLPAPEGKKNAVVMGRKTWESIPSKFRPLPGRLNVILTRSEDMNVPGGCLTFSDLTGALMDLSRLPDIDQIFIIGGAQVYHQAIVLASCRFLHITEIQNIFDCDAFFPDIPADFIKRFQSDALCENGQTFVFSRYEKTV